MIKTGIDLVLISRVAEKVCKNPKFLKTILTGAEVEYCKTKSNSDENLQKMHESIAGLYAGKEAFFKALGTGIQGTKSFSWLEISHDKNGAPFFIMGEKAKELLGKYNIKNVALSISHDGDFATAICVMES